MSITANIVADSINSTGNRITTFVVNFPRIVLAELNTHRALSKNSASCLHGDTKISIERPCKLKNGYKSVQSITIKELVDKWHLGDSLGRNMKTRLKSLNLRCLNEDTNEFITTNIVDCFYSGVKDLYEITLEDNYKIICSKEHRIFSDRGWITLNDVGLGENSFGMSWDKNAPQIASNGINISREEIINLKNQGFSMTQISKLKNIDFKSISRFCETERIFFRKIQVPNENVSYKDVNWLKNQLDNGLFAHQIAKICNTTVDRVKHSISKNKLKGNKWHWGMQPTWNKNKTYHLAEASLINVRKAAEKRKIPNSYKKYKDFYTSVTRFLTEIRVDVYKKFDYKCQLTGGNKQLELHHIDPIWHNKDLAFDINNIILITKRAHRFIHSNNLDLEFLKWHIEGKPLSEFIEKFKNLEKKANDIRKPVGCGNKLFVKFNKIKNIKYVGKHETYDLEVSGKYHNFVADGIVVHNSRAIPFEKMLEMVKTNPFIPIKFQKDHKGMQGTEYYEGEDHDRCVQDWLNARDAAVGAALNFNPHKKYKISIEEIN